MTDKCKLFLKFIVLQHFERKEKILWNLSGLERISFGPSSVIRYKEDQNKICTLKKKKKQQKKQITMMCNKVKTVGVQNSVYQAKALHTSPWVQSPHWKLLFKLSSSDVIVWLVLQ